VATCKPSKTVDTRAFPLRRGRPRRRDRPQLHQQPGGVDLSPVLDDLAPGDSMDGDSLHPHVSARGRDTEEVAGVLAVTNDPADDGVAVGVLVLDLVMEVREGVEPLDEA
jgi:hypothetical protein